MPTESNKQLVRRYTEGVWTGDDSVFRELLAPDCVIHGIGGPSDIQAIIQAFRDAIPDLSGTIEEMIAEGDKVVTRWTWRGTHTGKLDSPFGVVPPTGKSITYTGITINRMADNKIVDDRFEGDLLGLWQQLGALPSPEDAQRSS